MKIRTSLKVVAALLLCGSARVAQAQALLDPSPSPSPGPDTTPPGEILNLAVTLTSDGRTFTPELSWTAPGDDGYVGWVSSYEVRWSENPLADPTGWTGARVIAGAPEPDAPFSTQVMWPSWFDLMPEMTAYFGVLARDDAGLSSPIAFVMVTTPPLSPSPSPTPPPGGFMPGG